MTARGAYDDLVTAHFQTSERGVHISVQGLSHTYRSRGGVTVLESLDFELPPGGYASISGPSGAGKSTLLSLLGGLERPQSGRLIVGGTDLVELEGDDLAAYRRSTVGFVFQHFGLIGTLTARENIELAFTLTRSGRAVRRARTRQLLDAVGLGDRADHRPSELSGGERQRVAIARSLANSPPLVLADEPTGNLDADSAVTVIEVLEQLQRECGCSLVIVSHNRLVSRRAAVRHSLRRGRLQAA